MNHMVPYPGVLQVEFSSRREMTLSMCRTEEFFESPFQSVRGKYFSLEDFLFTYADETGRIDYFHEWEGFNVPRTALDRFNCLFKDQTKREKEILALVLETDCAYLIATESDGDPTTFEHELAHAKYALDPKYRKAVRDIIMPMPKDLGFRMQADLRAAGYPDDRELLLDEVHAYLKTSTEKELLETFPHVNPAERARYEKLLRASE